MKAIWVGLVAALGMVLVAGCNDKSSEPKTKQVSSAPTSPFPGFELPAPADESARGYLGISGDGTFKVAELKSDVLIIELFSLYCVPCQREAPVVNELYQAIQGRPDLKERVKIVGIGAGNTEREVAVFQKKYRVPFPMIPDKYNKVAQTLKVTKTPTFVGVKTRAGGGQDEFFRQTGSIGSGSEFLEKMLSLAGLEREN